MKYFVDFAALAILYIFVFFRKWKRKGRDVLFVNSLMYIYLSFVLYFTLMPVITKLYPIKWTHKEKRIPSSGHVERQCVPWKWTHQQIGNP